MEEKDDGKKKSTSGTKEDLVVPTVRVESADPESPDTNAETPSQQTAFHGTGSTEEDLGCVPSNSSSDSNSFSQSKHSLFSSTEKQLIRSTSLQSNIPKKKIVRFADTLGLDLEEVMSYRKGKAPKIPDSAFADLKLDPLPKGHPLPTCHSAIIPGASPETRLQFVPQFAQPGGFAYFLDRVKDEKVCLENVVVNDDNVTGYIRISNLGFEKLVQVRYTTDSWESYSECDANHVPSSTDGVSDKFTFKLNIPPPCLGNKLIFCIRYVVNNDEFWDSNYHSNYVIKWVAVRV